MTQSSCNPFLSSSPPQIEGSATFFPRAPNLTDTDRIAFVSAINNRRQERYPFRYEEEAFLDTATRADTTKGVTQPNRRQNIHNGFGPSREGESDVLAHASAIDHLDAGTVATTQTCVEQLQKLGFGSAAEGGVNRLVVYAQAAGGDLVEAIDMITEEQEAYGGFL